MLRRAARGCGAARLRIDSCIERITGSNAMENILLVILLILALCLIGAVLLQRSEGGGLGMGSGGGGGVMSGRAAATALGKLTWVLGAGFMITAIALTIVTAQKSGSSSVADQLGADAPSEATESAPVPAGEDLLPPTTADAPLAPTRADD